MLSAGDAFLIPDVDKSGYSQHLWIIISDPTQNPQEVLLVNVTSWECWKEDTCLIEPDDCKDFPFIRHRSCVDYRLARIEKCGKIEKLAASGLIKKYSTISPQLLAKIRAGAQQSCFLPNKCQLFLADQGLLEL
jgi:hypothetical protein